MSASLVLVAAGGQLGPLAWAEKSSGEVIFPYAGTLDSLGTQRTAMI